RQFRGGNHSQSDGLISGNFAISSRREFGLRDDVLFVEKLGRLTKVISSLQRLLICQSDGGQLFAKLAFNKIERRLQRPSINPVNQTEREHVLAAVDFLSTQA